MSSRSGNPGGSNGGAVLPVILKDRSSKTDSIHRGEHYFQRLFDNASDSFIVLGESGQFIDVNPAACQLIGFSRNELIGRSVSETIETTADFEMAWEKFVREGKYCWQCWLVRADGCRRLIEITATARVFPGHHFAIWRDLTGQYFLENELVKRERDESVTRLAAGIAHDFTNLLHVIGGHAELMTQHIAPNPELQENIDRILSSTRRASALIAQLSALGRQQILSPTVIDLNGLVKSCHETLEALVPGNVKLAFRPVEQPAPVDVDRTQAAQIIYTLASACSDSLANGGQIIITVKNVKLKESLERPGVRVPSGDYVVLEMQTSAGKQGYPSTLSILPPEERLGSGSVLPAISATVRQNNGFLWVAGDSAEGMIFSVYFHRMEGYPLATPRQEASVKLGGNETILLVDDDPTLREAAREYLKSLGYHVLPAGNGEEALTTVASLARLDAVIADLRMPKMGGEELAEKLSARMPGIKVIFMSGNIDRNLLHSEGEPAGTALLFKPFQLRTLVSMLRDLLDGKNARRNFPQ
jgi:two-component system cell cycle sensor histidine kinase/response regulator CckA